MKRILLCLLPLAFVTGCLERETTHTLYLEPDGAVRWDILETGVRSDDDKPASARLEEREYLERAALARHDLALGLESLGARPTTRVLRAERPFTLHSSATFPALEGLAVSIERALQGAVRVEYETHGVQRRLSLIFDEAAAERLDEENTPALALLLEADTVEVVLVEGRFESAEGFRLVNDRTARLLERDDDEPGPLTLVWNEPLRAD